MKNEKKGDEPIYRPALNERQNEAKEDISGWWFIILVIVSALLLLNGCKTIETTKTEYIVRTDTLREISLQRDSVHVTDSIFVREKGDTLYMERWHTKYIEKLRVDTLYECKTDTVCREVEVVREKAVPLRKKLWYVSLGGYFTALLGLVVYSVLRLRKWLVLRRQKE